MQWKFIILIGVVLVFTAIFCVLLWRQTSLFQKRAIEARDKQEEQKKILKKEIMELKQIERKQRRAEAEAQAEAEARAAVDLVITSEQEF